MAELRSLCERTGLRDVRTYIQSGNVVCTSSLAAPQVKATIEKVLAAKLGKPYRALIRTVDDLEKIVKRNPFPDAAPNQLLIVFLDEAPPKNALTSVTAPGRERLALQGRELFIHFPEGQGRSKLKVPFAGTGTGRNLNTVRALIALAREPG